MTVFVYLAFAQFKAETYGLTICLICCSFPLRTRVFSSQLTLNHSRTYPIVYFKKHILIHAKNCTRRYINRLGPGGCLISRSSGFCRKVDKLYDWECRTGEIGTQYPNEGSSLCSGGVTRVGFKEWMGISVCWHNKLQRLEDTKEPLFFQSSFSVTSRQHPSPLRWSCQSRGRRAALSREDSHCLYQEAQVKCSLWMPANWSNC